MRVPFTNTSNARTAKKFVLEEWQCEKGAYEGGRWKKERDAQNGTCDVQADPYTVAQTVEEVDGLVEV